jgi:uncharacterized protein (TIGR03083 family)
LTALRADGAAFRAAVDQPGALSLNVPSCPEWSVGDLVRHLGAVYRRTHSRISTGRADQPWGPPRVPDDAPAATDEAVLTWFERELGQLDSALDAVDAELPAWNWAPQAKVAAFWHRRMAHETAVHRWDAQLSTGLSEPIEAKLAADTVTEVLDTWLPAGRGKGPRDVHGMVRLTATDPGPEWYVRLRGEGLALLDTDTLLDDDEHPARAAAAGPASDLALALWGRVAFDVLDTGGDERLLEALRVG